MKRIITKYLLVALLICSYTFKVQAQKYSLNVNEHSDHAIDWDSKLLFIGEDKEFAYYSVSGEKKFNIAKVDKSGNLISENEVVLSGAEKLKETKAMSLRFINDKAILFYEGFSVEEQLQKVYACPLEDDGTLNGESAVLIDEYKKGSNYLNDYLTSITYNGDTSEFVFLRWKWAKADNKLACIELNANSFSRELEKKQSAKFQLQVTGMGLYFKFGSEFFENGKVIVFVNTSPRKVGTGVSYADKDVVDNVFSCDLKTGKFTSKAFPIERMRKVESMKRTKENIFLLGYIVIEKKGVETNSLDITKRFVIVYNIETGTLLNKTLPIPSEVLGKLDINYGSKPINLGTNYTMSINSTEVGADGSITYSIMHYGWHKNENNNVSAFENLKISAAGAKLWSASYPMPDIKSFSMIRGGNTYLFYQTLDKDYSAGAKNTSLKDLVLVVYNSEGKKTSEQILYSWDWSSGLLLMFESFAWISDDYFLFELKKKDTAFFASMTL